MREKRSYETTKRPGEDFTGTFYLIRQISSVDRLPKTVAFTR
jgi:hypothetical protein